jgi:glyoxylase I family protein
MERVAGIGGLFFRARDPVAIGRWYEEHLGVTPPRGSYDEDPWSQEAGPTVFAPFSETTPYFGDQAQTWMVNFRVRDLNAMLAQLRTTGIQCALDTEISRMAGLVV